MKSEVQINSFVNDPYVPQSCHSSEIDRLTIFYLRIEFAIECVIKSAIENKWSSTRAVKTHKTKRKHHTELRTRGNHMQWKLMNYETHACDVGHVRTEHYSESLSFLALSERWAFHLMMSMRLIFVAYDVSWWCCLPLQYFRTLDGLSPEARTEWLMRRAFFLCKSVH